MRVRSYVARVKDSASLYDLVDNVIQTTLPDALQSRNMVVNEISPVLEINTDQKILAHVISGMLSTILQHSRSSYIRISAKRYHGVMIIHVRDFNVLGNWEKYDVKPLQIVAKKIGGVVAITSHRQFETTIAFSFPNLDKVPGQTIDKGLRLHH